MKRRCIRWTAFFATFGALAWPAPALTQCMLANPSFEIAGSGGNVFGGWNQFGSIGSYANAPHGSIAAKVSGPNTGPWTVSGYWQQLDSAPGDRWSASALVMHPSSRPLTGTSQAIVNIEWRNSGGALISYESHTAASSATPTDRVSSYSFQSLPAPAGTVKARILVGVLQGPGEPVPDVIYDQVGFDQLGTPSLDQIQWLDFAGGRTLTFSGRSWRVKGTGYYGPGPNLFSNSTGSVWVDGSDRLHLAVRNISGAWYSSEVALEQPLGYGDYVFTTRGRLDTLDPKIVLGMFIWQYGPCFDPANGWWNPYNEIDVEFSRWGNPGNPGAQFVAQPYDWPGNLSPFSATFAAGEVTSHAFRWLPDRVEFRSWRGGPDDESTSAVIHTWSYEGPHVPRPEQPRVHLNLWQFDGAPASYQEVVFDAFNFVPACGAPNCGTLAVGPNDATGSLLTSAQPNPFGQSTLIRYAAARGGPVEIAVYDLSGRRVRTLFRGPVLAGDHEVAWDGSDESGRRLAAGVYLYRLRMDNVAETRRVVLVK